MNAMTRFSTKGQITIPKEVRDRHGWREGTTVEVIDQGDAVLLRPVAPRGKRPWREAFAEARRILNYQGPPLSNEDIDRAIDELFRRGEA